MTTAVAEAAPKPRGRRAAKPVTFRIVFEVGPDSYHVIPLRPNPLVASHAYRLKKADGTTYDVHVDEHGPHCECPGYVAHGLCKSGLGCRHIRCLVAAGMIPAPPGPDQKK